MRAVPLLKGAERVGSLSTVVVAPLTGVMLLLGVANPSLVDRRVVPLDGMLAVTV